MIEKHNEVVGSGIVCRNIKGSTFQNLRDKCKEYGVTLNSALTVAMSAALQKGEKIDAIIAVNTRPLFNYEEKSGLANFASCIQPSVKYALYLYALGSGCIRCRILCKIRHVYGYGSLDGIA